MKRFFTPYSPEEAQTNDMKRSGKLAFAPRKETLELLCQFARVYRSEPKLMQGLCSYVLN